MPRLSEDQLEDHYDKANRLLEAANARNADLETQLPILLEALIHAVLDAGVGLAGLQQTVREAAEYAVREAAVREAAR